ncbi:hypothetical protein D3C72_1881370 [compost metagenome]
MLQVLELLVQHVFGGRIRQHGLRFDVRTDWAVPMAVFQASARDQNGLYALFHHVLNKAVVGRQMGFQMLQGSKICQIRPGKVHQA